MFQKKVFLAADSNYFKPLTATLFSLLENCRAPGQLAVTVMASGFKGRQNYSKIQTADQSILNGILKNDWQELPLEWNRPRILLDYPRKAFGLNKSVYRKLVESPEIIHFSGKVKPWHYRYVFDDKRLYNRYLKKAGLKQGYTDKTLFNKFIYRPLRWIIYKFKMRYFLEKLDVVPQKFR